jgi:hypothetical protein
MGPSWWSAEQPGGWSTGAVSRANALPWQSVRQPLTPADASVVAEVVARDRSIRRTIAIWF